MFVGKDVATALGYSNTSDALNKHVDREDKGTVAFRDAIGQEQKSVVINESGLYALILSSKLPQAKAFKRWEGFFFLLTPLTRYAIYWQQAAIKSLNPKILRIF